MASFYVHVTDAVCGRPAEGVPVRAYDRLDGGWTQIGLDRTDVHVRVAVLLDTSDETLARLELDMDPYFATLGVKPVHPVITLTFRVTGQRPGSRIRLLVAPSAYVTYLEI